MVHEPEVDLPRLGLEARVEGAPGVVGAEVVVHRLDAAGQRPLTQGGVGHQRDVQVGARRGDAVVEDVRRPETQLDLDGDDRGDAGGPADGRGRDLAQRDPPYHPLLDVLFLEVLEGDLQRGRGVDPGHFEDVDAFGPGEVVEDLVDAGLDRLGSTVAHHGAPDEGALDAQHHLRGVFGVLAKVRRHHGLGVALGGAVELAGVPKVAARLERRPERFEDLGLGEGRGARWEAYGVMVGSVSRGCMVRVCVREEHNKIMHASDARRQGRLCDVMWCRQRTHETKTCRTNLLSYQFRHFY